MTRPVARRSCRIIASQARPQNHLPSPSDSFYPAACLGGAAAPLRRGAQPCRKRQKRAIIAGRAGMLEIRHLVKYFGPLVAVDDVSFTVPKGEVLGFLG